MSAVLMLVTTEQELCCRAMSAGDIYHHTGRMLSLCCQSNGYTAKEEPAKGHCPHKRQWPLHCFDKICLIIRLYPISRHVFIAAGRHRHICQMRLCGVVVITYILRCTLKNRGYDPLSSVCASGSVMVWRGWRLLELVQTSKLNTARSSSATHLFLYQKEEVR